ncbi:hypothetical protein Q9233_006883 [Columba guinea]|nr:hypothetical protein Q9233_006883 [Columba guinea]
MRSLRGAPPVLLLLLTLLLAAGHGAVITGACDRDQQCGGGMCCAVSLWIRSLRMCTPMGNLGEECHPLSHRVSTRQEKPLTIPSCLTNIKTGDEILCCSSQDFQEGLVVVDAFILGRDFLAQAHLQNDFDFFLQWKRGQETPLPLLYSDNRYAIEELYPSEL